MIVYITLDEYLNEFGFTETPTNTNAILRALRDAAREINAYCNRSFYPTKESVWFDYLNSTEIELTMRDLIECTEVLTANGDVEVTDYHLYCGDDLSFPCKNRIIIDDAEGDLFYIKDTNQRCNKVTGTWLYHEYWSEAWLDTLDTVRDAPLTAGATSLEVSDADGVDADGFSPRCSVGHLIQVGDEWCYVAAVDATSTPNTLTIVRAQQGTTAAEHAQGTSIYTYQPMSNIKRASMIIARYLREMHEHPCGVLQPGGEGKTTRLTVPVAAMELIDPYRRPLVGTYTASQSGRLYA